MMNLRSGFLAVFGVIMLFLAVLIGVGYIGLKKDQNALINQLVGSEVELAEIKDQLELAKVANIQLEVEKAQLKEEKGEFLDASLDCEVDLRNLLLQVPASKRNLIQQLNQCLQENEDLREDALPVPEAKRKSSEEKKTRKKEPWGIPRSPSCFGPC